MAQQHISIGTPPSGLDGDTGRVAFEKTEANFTELYGRIDSLESVVSLMAGKNALINGNFDIWQRGTLYGPATGNYFLADRWLASSGVSTIQSSLQNFAVSQTEVPNSPRFFYRATVASAAGAANYATLRQRIERVNTFAGQAVTLSFWAKANAPLPIAVELAQRPNNGGGAGDVTGIGASKINITTSWAKYSVTMNVPVFAGAVGANDYLELLIWFDAGSSFSARTAGLGQQSGTFDIAQVQLVPGDQDMPFESLSLAQTLAMCQRYYEKSYLQSIFPGAGGGSGEGRISHGITTVMGATWYVPIRFTTTKRSIPTVSIYAANPAGTPAFVAQDDGSTVGASLSNVGTTGFQIGWANSAGRWGGFFHYSADAEL